MAISLKGRFLHSQDFSSEKSMVLDRHELKTKKTRTRDLLKGKNIVSLKRPHNGPAALLSGRQDEGAGVTFLGAPIRNEQKRTVEYGQGAGAFLRRH